MTNHKNRRRNYVHGEAFCLMTYVAADGSGDSEVVWNSRDGVTPFIISLRDGREARHDMRRAVRALGYVPAIGSRIFVDLTPGRAVALAAHNAAHWWSGNTAGCRTRWTSVEAFAADLATDYLRTPGAPDLIEVTEWPIPPDEVVIDSDARTADHYPGRGGW